MNLLVVTEHPGQSGPYINAACSSGWRVRRELNYSDLPGAVAMVEVDAAVLITERVDDTILQAVRILNSKWPMPVVLYTEDSLQRSIRSAVEAGVSVYVVDCNNVARIGALLDIAIIRFAESQKLKKELDKAKTSLAERNTVDKAKGIIMQQRKVSEDAAYRLLRKLAMDRNRRIGEVAGDVIAAADVLF